ncbi:penicillin-binding protein activator [Bacteroidota bacterium]
MRKISIYLLAFLFISSIQSCKKDEEPTVKEMIKIGALLPLTGDLSTKGLNAKAGLELAKIDINAWFETQGINKEIELVIKDTKNDAIYTFAQCIGLNEDSINVIIGPMISNNLAAIRDFCIENSISLISPSSTNPDLAISDDNIYRLAPDDHNQASALAKTMYDDGIRKQITFMKPGSWEETLNDQLILSFEELGGEASGVIPYNPRVTDNFESDVINLTTALTDLLTGTTAEKIAIQLISFDEGVAIMEECFENDILSQVRWYGSDGFTLSNNLLDNENASAFAVSTELCSPLFSEPESDKYLQTKSQIEEKSGLTADIYAVNAYDACWIAALALNNMNNYSASSFDIQLNLELDDYTAASGPIELNEFGDRTNVLFDIWQVVFKDGEYVWEKISTI